MIKAKPWNGRDLKGVWEATIKIDGVRALWNGHEWRSRADKPLYNIPTWNEDLPEDCEVFVGSFRDTIRAVRTQHLKADTPIITEKHLYTLDDNEGGYDERLFYGTFVQPTAEKIRNALADVVAQGYEGLVIRSCSTWLKVKPEETHDVPVTGWGEGKGKHSGRLGFLKTPLGEVGTGFSDEERAELFQQAHAGTLCGQIIEVSCMQFTPDGKFRHPRFVRMRPDKAV